MNYLFILIIIVIIIIIHRKEAFMWLVVPCGRWERKNGRFSIRQHTILFLHTYTLIWPIFFFFYGILLLFCYVLFVYSVQSAHQQQAASSKHMSHTVSRGGISPSVGGNHVQMMIDERDSHCARMWGCCPTQIKLYIWNHLLGVRLSPSVITFHETTQSILCKFNENLQIGKLLLSFYVCCCLSVSCGCGSIVISMQTLYCFVHFVPQCAVLPYAFLIFHPLYCYYPYP